MVSSSEARAASDNYNRYDDEFGTVIDMVEAGADNTGQQSVDEVIRKHRGDDTLLKFPPGEYYMDEQVRFTGFRKFGLVGKDATFRPADYHTFDGPQYRLFRLGVDYSPGHRLVFDGFDVDQTAADTGIRVIETVVTDGLEVRDVSIRGQHDSGTWGPGRFVISDPNGEGLVERFEAPSGGEWVNNTPNDGNLWRGPSGIVANQNAGTIRFKDCALGAFPDNGLYASGGDGKIVVDGGHFANSNAANVRIGGVGSVVRNATVTVDQIRPRDEAHRGIRLENGRDLRVENVTVENTAPMPGSYGISVMNTCGSAYIDKSKVTIRGDEVDKGIVVSPSAGKVSIVETGIVLETPGGNALHIKGNDDPAQVICEYMDIIGDAGDEVYRAAIRCDRDNVRFGEVNVNHPGGNKRKALINTGDDVTVYEGDYLASNHPIVDLGTGTHVEDIYAKSHNGYEAVCLYDESADVYLKTSTLRGGIQDFGCEGLKTAGNEY